MEISKEQIQNFNNEFKQLKMAGGNIKRTVAKAEMETEQGGVWKEGRIPRKILKQIGEEAYKENPRSSLRDDDGNSWRLVDKFPTMVSYQSPAYRFKYVVGIRGTKLTSFTDIKADVAHLFGKVGESDRYQKDKEYLLNMINRHGKHNRFILVGHSLSGSIIRRLAKDLMTKNYIEYTLSYNPSFELSDTKQNKPDEKIHEVYSENDPLLKLRQVVQPNVQESPNVEIKREEDKGLLESHTIENPAFEGGVFKIPNEVKNLPQFKNVKSGVYKNLNMIKYMGKQKKYKKMLKDAKPNRTMNRWIKEDWVNVKEMLKGRYKPCGRPTLETEPYPLCRPMKKISADTPITLPTLIRKGAKNKIIEAVKAKEANPDIRISWRKMVKEDDEQPISNKKMIKIKKKKEEPAPAPVVDVGTSASNTFGEAPAKKKITIRKKKEEPAPAPVIQEEVIKKKITIKKKK